MFGKLALRNAKRQASNYMIYFVTIIITASLMYSFNALIFSEAIKKLSTMMDYMPILIVLASIIIVFIMAWLINYVSKFMLTKRSKELGTYLLLGIEKKQVNGMFLKENLLIGFVALLLGIILGNLIFQVLTAMIMGIFAVTYSFNFVFSIKSILLTALYFIVIYFFVSLKGRKLLNALNIHGLIYFEKQNENILVGNEKDRMKLFVISIISGIIGVFLLVVGNLPIGLLGATFVIFFCYGFFISFSSGIPTYFNKRVEKKYKGNNLMAFRSLTAKVGSMGMAMGTICLLMTSTLIAGCVGMLFQTQFTRTAKLATTFDLYISTKGDNIEEYLDYVDNNIIVSDSLEYHLYAGEDASITEYLKSTTKYYDEYPTDPILSFSDYAELRKMLGYSPVALEEGKYIIHSMEHLGSILEKYNRPITAGGRSFSHGEVYTENLTQMYYGGNGKNFVVVLADEVVNNLKPIQHMYAASSNDVSSSKRDELDNILYNRYEGGQPYDDIFSKETEQAQWSSLSALVVFPLFYLAIVLMITASTILAIQILSDSNRYKEQYRMLNVLGMENEAIRKTMRSYFTFFYFMPVVPPVLISSIFAYSLGNMMDPGVFVSRAHLWSVILSTLALFALIYVIYIVVSYTSFKRSILIRGVD